MTETSTPLTLRQLRDSLGLSQQAMVAARPDLLGADKSRISQIERKPFRNTRVWSLEAYLAAMECELFLCARTPDGRIVVLADVT